MATGDQWSRLVQYYQECLVRENRQQFIIRNDDEVRLFVPADPARVTDCLAGSVYLEFGHTRDRPSRLAAFVEKKGDRRGKQLCLGYPVFVVSYDRLAPLLVSVVQTERHDGLVRLAAEDTEISYAALGSEGLGLDPEEIAAVLKECDQVQPGPGQSSVQALDGFLRGRISEIVGRPLPVERWVGSGPVPLTPGSLVYAPCLFWVSESPATSSLIKELGNLAVPSCWKAAPTALQQLLSSVPIQSYPEVPPLSRDRSVYVAEVNDEQRRAIAAAQRQPVTVVTGPPGTGKSQMVLNLVARAVMNHQTVLFASRNNEAVNVVMTRLREEVSFPGAIRTGRREYRETAARDMERSLALISASAQRPPSVSLANEYLRAKEQAEDAEQRLHQIRELEGLLNSHVADRGEKLQRLREPVREAATSWAPDFRRDEADILQASVWALLVSVVKAKSCASELEDEMARLCSADGVAPSLVSALRDSEDHWGTFGGGFLHPGHFDVLEDLDAHIEIWLALLPALEAQARVTRLAREYRDADRACLQKQDALPRELLNETSSAVLRLGDNELQSLAGRLGQTSNRLSAILEGRQRVWERFLIWLGFINPQRMAAARVEDALHTMGLRWRPWALAADPGLSDISSACRQLSEFAGACTLHRRTAGLQVALDGERATLQERIGPLPPALRADIPRLELTDSDAEALREPLEHLQARVGGLIERRVWLAERIARKLEGNEDGLVILDSFRSSPAGTDEGLWHPRSAQSLTAMAEFLTQWRTLVSVWEVQEAIGGLRRRLAALPSPDEAANLARQTRRHQMELGSRVLESRWLERATDLDTATLGAAADYAAAARQIAGPYDPNTWGPLADALQRSLPAAVQVFPIWATTNLSAKTNFPLQPGLFDLVVIDEASQCDVPSALPLLYRGKCAVVIGDRDQLRHVATLRTESDHEVAAQYGISSEAFLYSDRSLFDVAHRSVGARPGAIMLTKHYRSHPEIITFSNEAFYAGLLEIETDLARRGVPVSFLGRGCGVYWLHVDGRAEHPAGGSAVNPAETAIVLEFVRALVDAIEWYEREGSGAGYTFDIGIVTPYRKQANQLERLFADQSRITVGTAHTFQGNERDVMVFSPVMAPGLKDRSLGWLNDTDNLLNVAITRARLLLIVIGNWDYCHNPHLKADRYRRLAEYVGDRLGHRVTRIADIPLFGGGRVEPPGPLAGDEHTRTTLARLIRSCRQYVWWLDPGFDSRVFQVIWDAVEHPEIGVGDIRLLTAREQTLGAGGAPPQLDVEMATALRTEMRDRAIEFEMRVLPRRELPVGRFLYSVGNALAMPDFGKAFVSHRRVSEFAPSDAEPELFEQYWERAAPV